MSGIECKEQEGSERRERSESEPRDGATGGQESSQTACNAIAPSNEGQHVMHKHRYQRKEDEASAEEVNGVLQEGKR